MAQKPINVYRRTIILERLTQTVPVTLLTDTVLLPVDQYDIYAMTVSANDTLTFNAMRMNDGAKVIGEISNAGQVRILDTALNTEVVVLERIR